MAALEFEVRERIALVTMNRPEKLNAINDDMRGRFVEVFEEIERDDAVKVVVLTGAGPRAFSAGADLNEAGKRTAYQRRNVARRDPANLARACSKPVIAMLHGFVLGGGAELATSADIRIASTDTVIGYPEIKHGWLPAGGGGTQSLPRLVGMSRAMMLILTGRNVDAAHARELGLVDEVVESGELLEVTWNLAREIASHRLRALILAKAALRMTERAALDVGLEYERELATLTYYFEDRQEAIKAFQEGRPAKLSD